MTFKKDLSGKEHSMTEGSVKAVIVGLRHGHVGRLDPQSPSQGYIHSFKQIPGVEIVAYCEDTDPRLLEHAQAFDPQANCYHDLETMIAEEDFDFAVVVLPATEVTAAGIKLAEAGKHFFMEKQFARTADEMAELVHSVQRNQVICQAGYPWRFHPAMQDLQRWIEEGKLGRTLSIDAQFVTTQVRPGLRDPSNFNFTKAGEGGGILHMLGCHYLDLMRFLAGCEVKSVQAMTSRTVGYIEDPLEDVAIVVMEYEDGALGNLHSGYMQPVRGAAYASAFSFWGREGYALWPSMGAEELTVHSTAPEWSGAQHRTFRYSLRPAAGYGGEWWIFEMLQDFVNAVRTGSQPAVTAEDGWRVLKVIDAAYESARTGQRVDLNYDLA
jgi:UDP-N-acetylglucosamine 3-dehydrogenase